MSVLVAGLSPLLAVALRWKNGQAVLTVADTGVGIPEEDVPRVFERFYRVRATHGRSHEGTGIGLALVEELTRLHGGTVSVESRLGEGTTFTVKLPRGRAHLPADRIESTPRACVNANVAQLFVQEAGRWDADVPVSPEAGRVGASELTAEAERMNARILVVDDNADLREYVTGLLVRHFTHVETARNGLEALSRARASPPDVVLSDVMMPGWTASRW